MKKTTTFVSNQMLIMSDFPDAGIFLPNSPNRFLMNYPATGRRYLKKEFTIFARKQLSINSDTIPEGPGRIMGQL